jgi:hypothetical protein
MAGITVSIVAGADAAHSSVNATGSIQHVITDKEVKTFGIQDSPLKNAIGKYFGKNPNDAYLHSPTPWNDLYTTYGWPQVQTVLIVQNAMITGITSQPVVVATRTFTNQSSKKAVFDASISDQVANTTESNWSSTDTIEVAQKFTYNVSFLGAGGGGETSMSYSHQWGQGGSESTSITVGSSSGVSVELNPGESIEAQLTASRGVMKVRITYRAQLTGTTAINYNPTFKDHHFWAQDIGGVMQAGGLSNSIQFTEDIEVGYFSNAKIELRDPKGNLKSALLGAPALAPVLEPVLA